MIDLKDLKGFLAECVIFSVGLSVGLTIMVALLFIPVYFMKWLIS